MNVATIYPGQNDAFMRAIGVPMHMQPPVRMTAVDHLKAERAEIDRHTSDYHEDRHAANMAAWRTLYQEAHDRGDHEVANNILTMKLIPNRS